MRGATSDHACAVRFALRGAGGVGLGHRSGGHAMPKWRRLRHEVERALP